MVTVIVIGLLSAVAAPQFSTKMKDRRANAAAQEVAMFYRTARSRAAGRGGAQMVRFTAAGGPIGKGELRMYEAVQRDGQGNAADEGNYQGSCGQLPVASCTTQIVWETGAADNQNAVANARLVTIYPEPTSLYNNLEHKLFASGGQEQAFADICFAPSGRSFYRTDAAGAWTPLASVPYVEVTRLDTAGVPVGIKRRILLLPNGSARLVL